MRTHRMFRSLAVVAALVVVLRVAATAAGAGVGPRDRDRDRNRAIAVGDILVTAGTEVDGPLLGVDGDATIAGTVDGDAFVVRGDLVVQKGGEVDGNVVVLRGDARINGTVDGDVVVIGGSAVVSGSATVDGDVVSTKSPRVAAGAKVSGDVQHVNIARALATLGFGLLVFWWIATTLSTAVFGALLLLVIPRGMEAGAAAGRSKSQWWVSLLVGIGLVIGIPVLAAVAIGSLLGLPLGLGLLGALGMMHGLGYVAGAFFLGRCILKTPKNRFGAFFVGWAILRVLALLPAVGMLVWVLAVTYGIGTLAVAGFRAGRARPRADDDGPPAVPAPGSPPAADVAPEPAPTLEPVGAPAAPTAPAAPAAADPAPEGGTAPETTE